MVAAIEAGVDAGAMILNLSIEVTRPSPRVNVVSTTP